jgi:hypothetical protein
MDNRNEETANDVIKTYERFRAGHFTSIEDLDDHEQALSARRSYLREAADEDA